LVGSLRTPRAHTRGNPKLTTQTPQPPPKPPGNDSEHASRLQRSLQQGRRPDRDVHRDWDHRQRDPRADRDSGAW
jgi:hypothetical protein